MNELDLIPDVAVPEFLYNGTCSHLSVDARNVYIWLFNLIVGTESFKKFNSCRVKFRISDIVKRSSCSSMGVSRALVELERGKMVLPIESLSDEWPEERTCVLLAPPNY